MFTQQSAIVYTRQFLEACKSLPVKIDKAILFGSAASGKMHEYSDIDLALFSENFTDNILKNIEMIGMVNIHFPDLDIHTYPFSDYSKDGLLLEEIKKTGIEIEV